MARRCVLLRFVAFAVARSFLSRGSEGRLALRNFRNTPLAPDSPITSAPSGLSTRIVAVDAGVTASFALSTNTTTAALGYSQLIGDRVKR